MIHTRLDGEQHAPNLDTKVRLSPFTTRTNTPGNLLIGLTATGIIDSFPVGEKDYLVQFRNVSTSGQIIGIDTANTVTIANAGILLYPGEETPPLSFLYTPFYGIADSTGGSLRRWTMRTT